MNTFPWWFQKLLLYYIPDYIVYMLEQPWIPMAIMGGMVLTTLITMIYAIYRVTRERRKRKAIETEHARLHERYEQLRINFEQQAHLSQKLLAACANLSTLKEPSSTNVEDHATTTSHNNPTHPIN
jgi:uncharacterized membrane protein